MLRWRNLVSIAMIVLLPLSLSAQEASGAILHSTGSGVFVNESVAPASIAVFPNDVIKTEKDVAARLQVTGSDAEINSETIVQFNTELALDHGSVTVNTSRGLTVRVGCITVTPVHDVLWTRYEVLDVNGKVTVSAVKDDVYIDIHRESLQEMNERDREQNRSLVREGEQKSREEKCGGAYQRPNAAALGGALDSPYAIGAAAIGIGAIACLGLCHHDDPLSPAKPR